MKYEIRSAEHETFGQVIGHIETNNPTPKHSVEFAQWLSSNPGKNVHIFDRELADSWTNAMVEREKETGNWDSGNGDPTP